ncbi:hypothetical protein FOB82_02420 [Corynebacterium xerosis]|uniref:Uncharacterized protein n=1 Tax=Corynebacterium xerosis TaxID=1725 RepID=A0A6B8TRF5_9CORY|nr:hypothetical protein [Corynebacterium xerosis]QGS33970.1 hypothetical protein FOB82_02420 [Corynebacterium xerosis]
MMHTPLDTLRYMVASDSIGAALEYIYDDSNDDAHDVAISMLETLRTELRYEANLHGVEGTAYYSTGVPVFAEGQHTCAEPRPDGLTEIVTHPTVWCPYPGDGGNAHPICRPEQGPAA